MGKFKFDVAIGNPPYQEEAPGESTSDKPIYHLFMDAVYEVAPVVELVTPGRFLFNAGGTPKAWNKKMLQDEHLKVEVYEPDSTKMFPGVAFEGGIAITYRDSNTNFGSIDFFVPWKELQSICHRVIKSEGFVGVNTMVSGRTPYLFTDALHRDFPDAAKKLSKGHMRDVSSNILSVLPEVFLDAPIDGVPCYRCLGRYKNDRAYRWIKAEYVRGREKNFTGKWKVLLPKANGRSSTIGESAARLTGIPVVGEPNDIATDTFIVIGAFDSFVEAENLMKYIKTKFCRVLLGILKITQDNLKDTWRCVPVQNFTSSSDIDWTQSIHGIDQQLYKKYAFTDEEKAFIENHVKEMD